MPKPNPAPTRYLSPAQLADLWSVSPRTVFRKIEAGELHVHHIGPQVRISEEDAAAYMAARRT